MFITCQQNKILKTFTCERLSSNVQNRILIDNVQNERNSNLVSYLKTQAWLEDESGECAHYLIKSNNEIALFFSIRTGCLFDKPVNENELSEILRIITTAINAKNMSHIFTLCLITMKHVIGIDITIFSIWNTNISTTVSYDPASLPIFLIKDPDKLSEKNLYECLCMYWKHSS